MTYYIYNSEESKLNDEPLFWSNKDGWTLLEGATKFTTKDKRKLNLPFGGEWVNKNTALCFKDTWQLTVDLSQYSV